jgi:hypothetical protein
MNIEEIKKKSDLKEDIDRLKKEIREFEFSDIGEIVDYIEEKCISKFEEHFRSNNFKVNYFKNFATAKHSATKIVIEKSKENKRIDHMIIRSDGIIDLDAFVKIDISNLSLKDYKLGEFKCDKFNDINDYKEEIERLKEIKTKKKDSKRDVDKSDFKFIYIDRHKVKKK